MIKVKEKQQKTATIENKCPMHPNRKVASSTQRLDSMAHSKYKLDLNRFRKKKMIKIEMQHVLLIIITREEILHIYLDTLNKFNLPKLCKVIYYRNIEDKQ